MFTLYIFYFFLKKKKKTKIFKAWRKRNVFSLACIFFFFVFCFRFHCECAKLFKNVAQGHWKSRQSWRKEYNFCVSLFLHTLLCDWNERNTSMGNSVNSWNIIKKKRRKNKFLKIISLYTEQNYVQCGWKQ